MMLDIHFLVFAHVRHVHQYFGIYICDHVWYFYDKCQTLIILNLMHVSGHHCYKEIWILQKDDILYCKKDYQSEALDKECQTNKVKVAVKRKRRQDKIL